jgi:hypothetical protein
MLLTAIIHFFGINFLLLFAFMSKVVCKTLKDRRHLRMNLSVKMLDCFGIHGFITSKNIKLLV